MADKQREFDIGWLERNTSIATDMDRACYERIRAALSSPSNEPDRVAVQGALMEAIEQGVIAAEVQHKSDIPSEYITIDYAGIVRKILAKLYASASSPQIVTDARCPECHGLGSIGVGEDAEACPRCWPTSGPATESREPDIQALHQKMSFALKAHQPNTNVLGETHCTCGMIFRAVDARGWHRHAAAMVLGAIGALDPVWYDGLIPRLRTGAPRSRAARSEDTDVAEGGSPT